MRFGEVLAPRFGEVGSSPGEFATAGVPKKPSVLSYDSLFATYNPVSWWKLGDSASPAVDSGSNGFNLTGAGGITFGSSKVVPTGPAHSVALDGTSGVASGTMAISSAAVVKNVTLIAWVELASTTPNGGPALYMGGSNSGFGIGIGGVDWTHPGNQVVVLFQNIRFIQSGTLLGANFPQLIALILDSNGFPRINVNGVDVYSDTSGTTQAASASNFSRIGNDGNAGKFMQGNVSEAGVILGQLTAAQLLALYNRGRFGT